uniref:Myb/SANT-like DNA-binding domain-containing protein n=1 Tax=Rhizophora mucronata TaxID=61149 RepID=A0A2P2KEE7_RHIMU
MASCDDDFPLIEEDSHHQTNHHHHILHQSYAPHRFSTKSTQISAQPQPILPPPASAAGSGASNNNNLDGGEEGEEADDNDTDSAFPQASPFSENSNPFSSEANVRTEKRTDREDQTDGGDDNNFKNNNYSYSYKRARASGSAAGEYRKDREEWSDAAITCLLEAYTEKFAQLNRGNLRGRDWEEVAATVSERCEKQTKTVEQCKNKVDNLKKRYKLERQRMSNGGVSSSHWPWFKRMEEIVGNSFPAKAAADEYKGSSGGSPATVVKQPKRYPIMTMSPVGQTNSVKSKSLSNTRWRRVVLKISGVALAGTGPNNIDPKVNCGLTL